MSEKIIEIENLYVDVEEKNILQNAISGVKDYATQQAAGDFFAGVLVTALSGAVGINKLANKIIYINDLDL